MITIERDSVKLLVVNNLMSGLRDGSIYDFARSFSKDGDEVVVRSTDGTTDIRRLVRGAERFDLVVASGGDGTIATVAYALANTGIPILPFPAGTANLLAINLQSPTEPHALAKLAREGKPLDFDLGEIEIAGNRYGFALMAGFGYDAAIMSGAAPAKRLLGPVAYFSAAIGNALPQHSTFSIDIDGRHIESQGIGVLAINFSKLQFDLSVTHENHPRDGMLDIAVLKTENAFGLLPALGAAFLDRTGDFPNRSDAIEFYRARECSIVADPPMEIQFDGEATNVTTPVTFRILPQAARFIVSSEGSELFA